MTIDAIQKLSNAIIYIWVQASAERYPIYYSMTLYFYQITFILMYFVQFFTLIIMVWSELEKSYPDLKKKNIQNLIFMQFYF